MDWRQYFVVTVFALVALVPGGAEPQAPRYGLALVPGPEDTAFPSPSALNNKGEVLITGNRRSYLWSRGKLTDLGVFGSLAVAASDLNDNGQVVGHGWSQNPNEMRAFLWEGGTIRELPGLGGTSSCAWAINNSGQVVGSAQTAGGTRHAVLWMDGEPHDLGTLGGGSSSASGINERGQVVGSSDTADGGSRAFLWENGRMKDLGVLPGYETSRATAINDRGVVLGVASRKPTGRSGLHGCLPRFDTCLFIYRDGRTSKLAALEGDDHNALSINAAGDVVGISFSTPRGQRAFLNRNGKVIELTDVLPRETSGEVYWASAINDNGLIVGAAKINDQRRMVLLTPR